MAIRDRERGGERNLGEELLAAYGAGPDKYNAKFTEVHEEFSGYLRHVGRRVTDNPEIADDNASETLAKLHSEIRSGRYKPLPGNNFPAYLDTIVKRGAIDHLRKQRLRSHQDLHEDLPAYTESEEEIVERLDNQAAIERATRGLSANELALLHNRYVKNLPPRVIAQQMGVEPEKIHSALHTLKSKMKKRLLRQGIEL